MRRTGSQGLKVDVMIPANNSVMNIAINLYPQTTTNRIYRIPELLIAIGNFQSSPIDVKISQFDRS